MIQVESNTAPKEELKQANNPALRQQAREQSQESRREIESTTASQEELDSAINAASDRREQQKLNDLPVGARKRIDKLTARAKSAEEELKAIKSRLPGGQESQPAAHSAGTEEQPATGASGDEAREAADFQTRVAAAKSKYSDYEAVVKAADSVQIPHDFGQALKKLPNGPEVAYLLAKHPDLIGEVLTKLKGLPAAQQKALATQLAQEIGGRFQHSQQFPNAQQFNEKLTALKTERGFKPLDVHKAINIHIDAVRVLHEAENGAEVVLHLADNLAEAEAISKVPAARQALAIAKLSARLEGVGREVPRTRVNPPPRPVGGSADTSGFDPYKDEIKSHSQYRKWRKGQGSIH